jgi:hypothetical protein
MDTRVTSTFIVATGVAVVLATLVSATVFRARGQWPQAVRVVLLALIAGLVIGTATHVQNLARAGLVPRPDLPFAYNVFWSALVVVDPAAALALLLRPRIGIVLVVAIMAIDLAVNLSVLGLTRPIAAQIAYAAMALGSMPIIMANVPKSEDGQRIGVAQIGSDPVRPHEKARKS